MSFEELSSAELKIVADAFAVESKSSTKRALVEALERDGVSWTDYLKMFRPEESEESRPADVATPSEAAVAPEEPVKKEGRKEAAVKDDRVLVKMDRENPLFEAYGQRFTQSHPYALMESNKAEALFKNIEGFRPAWPSEVEEFYS